MGIGGVGAGRLCEAEPEVEAEEAGTEVGAAGIYAD